MVICRRLDSSAVALLKAAPLSYPQPLSVHAPPAGFRVLRRQRTLATRDLDAAADRLLRWQVHRGAGLLVAASTDRVEMGEVVVLTLGLGRVAVHAPCRIVRVVDEADRRGFAYGTLPGHPESGEESFVLERRTDATVVFTVTAISRAATRLARLGGPATRVLQTAITDCYLRAIDRPGDRRTSLP